jgi:hypothetical protein
MKAVTMSLLAFALIACSVEGTPTAPLSLDTIAMVSFLALISILCVIIMSRNDRQHAKEVRLLDLKVGDLTTHRDRATHLYVESQNARHRLVMRLNDVRDWRQKWAGPLDLRDTTYCRKELDEALDGKPDGPVPMTTQQ